MRGTITRGLKKIPKRLLASFGPHRFSGVRGKLLVLAYHRVVPEQDPRFRDEQPAMLVTPDSLRKNICWIREHFEIVSLSTWLRKEVDSQDEKKCCALTFDDGWLDNYEFGFPIIKEMNAPVTMFCVPSMLETGVNYWPGRLVTLVRYIRSLQDPKIFLDSSLSWLVDAIPAEVLGVGNSNAQYFDQIIEACKIYRDDEINKNIDSAVSSLQLAYQESREVMNVRELSEMVSSGLVEVGSHTYSHARLNQCIDQDVLYSEVVGSRDALQGLLNIKVETFCYPNGFVTSASQKLVKENYLAGATLNSGWNEFNCDFSQLRRIGMQERIANNELEFAAKLSGLY